MQSTVYIGLAFLLPGPWPIAINILRPRKLALLRALCSEPLNGPVSNYRVAQKFGTIILDALTLSNINRFTKLFHRQNHKKICNNTISKNFTTPQVCRYTTLRNVKSLKSKLKTKRQHILRN